MLSIEGVDNGFYVCLLGDTSTNDSWMELFPVVPRDFREPRAVSVERAYAEACACYDFIESGLKRIGWNPETESAQSAVDRLYAAQ
jgi:hypothetical protein